MKSLHGAYAQISGVDYLLTLVAPSVTQHCEDRRTRINLLRQASVCLFGIVTHLTKAVDQSTSPFQHIAIANFREVASGVSNALTLLQSGQLADSLTFLRLPLEYMLDIVYLSMFPNSVSSYEEKAMEHNAKLVDGATIVRDPTDRLRFLNVMTMNKKIQAADCPDTYKEMVRQYNLLSNVVGHTSPERKMLSLHRTQDWENALGQLEKTFSYVVDLICSVDRGLAKMIERDAALSTEIDNIRSEISAELTQEPQP